MEFTIRESVLENIEQNTVNRIIYAAWDIQQALSALTFLLEGCDFEQQYSHINLRRFRCYEANMVISFGRAFEPTKKDSILSLKTVGISLNEAENELKTRLLTVRRKIVAHSDSEFMHFNASTFEIDGNEEIALPNIVHDEGLNFSETEFVRFEEFLRGLKYYLAKFIFKLSNKRPELLNVYKRPNK